MVLSDTIRFMADIYRAGGDQCHHPFDLLSTTIDRELVCAGCGGAWPTGTADAFEVLFIASAEEAVDQSNRISRLEEFISANFAAASCSACGSWIDISTASTGARVGELWACARHIGVAAAYLDSDSTTADTFLWAQRAGLLTSTAPEDRHRWEEIVSCIPEISSIATNGEIPVVTSVQLDPRILNTLGLPSGEGYEAPVDDILSAAAALLGVGEPASGPARALLLGVIAAADMWLRGEFDPDDELEEDANHIDHIHSGEMSEDDDEMYFGDLDDDSEADRLWRAIAFYSMPQLGLLRARAYVDLHGENLNEVTTVDGDMVDDLLVMTAARCAETLLNGLTVETSE